MKLRLSLTDINTLNVCCFTNRFAYSREFPRPLDTTLDNRDEGLDCNVTETEHIILHDLKKQRAGAGKSQTTPPSTEREAHRVIIVALLMHYRNRHVYLYHEEHLTKATTKQNIAMPPNNVTTLTQSNFETTTSTLLSSSGILLSPMTILGCTRNDRELDPSWCL